LGTVCRVWGTSGRAIWERSVKDLGDPSGESLLEWVLFAQSGERLGERSESDLGGIWAIVLGSRYWKAKSRPTFEYPFSVGYCLRSLGGVWGSDLGRIWVIVLRVAFGRQNRSVSSSILFQLGTVCPLWGASGRAIWERSGRDGCTL